MTLPVVGLLVDRPVPDEFGRLIADLRRFCRPLAPDDATPRPVAWVTTSPAIEVDGAAPRAVWVENADEAQGADAAVLLTDDPALAAIAPERTVCVQGSIDAGAIPWLGPYVRLRFRRARGLPSPLIVDAGPDGVRRVPAGAALDGPAGATALALASAAIARGDALLTAMAWGTPCVTDLASADAVGARDGVHVVVREVPTDDDARRLADDEPGAARLSRRARLLVEARHDRFTEARRVAAALRLFRHDPLQLLEGRLDELVTSPRARVRDRLNAAVAGLAGDRAQLD